MLSSHRLPWIADAGGFAIGASLTLLLAYILNAVLDKLFADNHDPALMCRVAFALIILAWGPFMAFLLYNIPELDAILIRAGNESILSPILNTKPITLLFILQLAVIIFAAACTAISFWRIRAHQKKNEAKTSHWQWKCIAALSALYLLVALTLILPEAIL
jgi:hypothetical protein